MSLFVKIEGRNKLFNDTTNELLEPFREKLTTVIKELIPTVTVVDWSHVNSINDGDKIEVHGFIPMNIGDSLYDPDISQHVVITEKNQNSYIKYIKVLVSAKSLEESTTSELLKYIKQFASLSEKVDGAEFQTMDMNKKVVKH